MSIICKRKNPVDMTEPRLSRILEQIETRKRLIRDSLINDFIFNRLYERADTIIGEIQHKRGEFNQNWGGGFKEDRKEKEERLLQVYHAEP